jgi:hypothetical protein
MNPITILVIASVLVFLGIVFYFFNYNVVFGQQLVNVSELDTLDRMRFTAIQMTILDLETSKPTNISNDKIAAEIYKYQQGNTTDRLTTFEIEELYRNITNTTS